MIPILIITRPAASGADFAASVLRDFGTAIRVIYAPALQIVPLDYNLPPVKHLVFTSAQAVNVAPTGRNLQAWCVGDATAHAARDKGFTVHNANGDAAALVALIVQNAPIGPMVHIAGRHRHGDIAAELTTRGITCTMIEAYDQTAIPMPDVLLQAATGVAPLVAPVFSARSGQGVLSVNFTAPLHIIAMSPAVASLFDEFNTSEVLTVDHPDANHMKEMTASVLRGLMSVGD